MTLNEFIELLENYTPSNDQEIGDKKLMLQTINTYKEFCFDRECLVAHMTASAIIFNETKTKVLFAYHNIYKSYSWLGGHNDKEIDCLKVINKEIKEESGLDEFKLLDTNFASIEVLPVKDHYKKGKYVSNHLHMNVTYVFIASEKNNIRIKPDENSSIKWIEINKLD